MAKPKPVVMKTKKATATKKAAVVAAKTRKPAGASARKKASAKPGAGKKKLAAKLDLASLPQRMVLIDVENTSSEERLLGVLGVLSIDRKVQRTELVAVGNWKAVGARTGRLLARSGATLMHSAPATGVRDWSDLWIAVAAGRWIAHARPGDRLDIVSDDHAFDAVADAAAGAGVEFHRISYRSLGAPTEETPREASPNRRRRGGRRRGGVGLRAADSNGGSPVATPHKAVEASPPHAHARPAPVKSVAASPAVDGSTTASPDDIREAIRSLTRGDPERWVNLDLVGSALREKGFTRPPGSPRLVTRARQVQDVEVSPTGMARIRPGAPATAAVTELAPASATEGKAARSRRPPRRRATSPSAARAISEG